VRVDERGSTGTAQTLSIKELAAGMTLVIGQFGSGNIKVLDVEMGGTEISERCAREKGPCVGRTSQNLKRHHQ